MINQEMDPTVCSQTGSIVSIWTGYRTLKTSGWDFSKLFLYT